MTEKPLQICSADELAEYTLGESGGIPVNLEKVYVTNGMMCFLSADAAREAGEDSPRERIALIVDTVRGKLAFLLKKSPLTLKSGSDTHKNIIRRILHGFDEADPDNDVREIVIESLAKLLPGQRDILAEEIDELITSEGDILDDTYDDPSSPEMISFHDSLGVEDYEILIRALKSLPKCLRMELIREFEELTKQDIQDLLGE